MPPAIGHDGYMEALILALILLGVGVWWLSRRRSRRPRALASTRARRLISGPDTVPPRLMNQLHSLTRDRRVSERLIERISFNHPHRSKRWCVEKAIYDIQRDRRS
jgi:hypothetical protein